MAPRKTRIRPNLYLIGFMGVGKSAVGRGVAKQLGFQFLDSDGEIERQQGRAISAIFAEQGEAYFRALERAFLDGGHPSAGQVVACGGGLVIPPGMRELLLSKGVVVCLFAQPETILQRTLGNAKRPLLNVADPEARVKKLMAERLPVYQRTGIGVCSEGRSLPEIIQNVTRVYQREAPRWSPPQAASV